MMKAAASVPSTEYWSTATDAAPSLEALDAAEASCAPSVVVAKSIKTNPRDGHK